MYIPQVLEIFPIEHEINVTSKESQQRVIIGITTKYSNPFFHLIEQKLTPLNMYSVTTARKAK